MSNIGVSFLIGGIVGSSFKNSMSSATNSIGTLSDKIKATSSLRIDVGNLIKMSEAGKTGTAEFVKLQNKLQKARIDTSKLSAEFSGLNKKLEGMRMRSRINLQVTSNINKIQSEISNARGLIATGAGAMGVITAHADVLQAQGEISSLGIDETGIEKITEAAKKFSVNFAGTTAPEFIRASYDIKSGISSLSDEGVAEFTRIAALTGAATKSTTADMTKLFALGYGIFREQFESDTDFANQFSNAISASVQAFRTDGPDLIQGISNLGATATAMGVSLSEQLAIIGTSKEAFNSASDAATGYRAFLDGVGKAEKELGLTFTDAAGKMLPMTEVLDSIKEKFGDSMESVATKDALKAAFGSAEAAKTISALINKTDSLRNAQKQLTEEMKAGTITESMAKAMQRGKELELLKQQFLALAESVGAILYPAFKLLAKGLGGIAALARILVDNCRPLGIALGFIGTLVISLAIAIKTLIIAKLALKSAWLSVISVARIFGIDLSRLTFKTATFTIKTKLSSAALRVKNIALKAVSLTAKGTGTVFTWLSKQFTLAKIKSAGVTAVMLVQRGVMLAITAATRSAAAAQWLMNSAFLACPITWIIAGIAAVAGTAYLIVKNWDKVVTWFWDFWEAVKTMFSSGFNFIAGILQTVYKLVLYPFNMISSVILSIFGKGGGPMAVFTDFWESVKTIFSSGFAFIESIAAVSEKLVSGFMGAIEAVKGWFGGDEEDNKIGIDVSKNLNVSNVAQNAAARGSVFDKYYGSDGIVTRANTVNKAANLSVSQNITIQGNADKEQVAAALSEGRVEFERRYNEMENRRERLSYAGGY